MRLLAITVAVLLTLWPAGPVCCSPSATAAAEKPQPIVAKPPVSEDPAYTGYYGKTRVTAQCKAQMTIPWCSPSLFVPKPITVEQIKSIANAARAGFKYKNDVVDSWGVYTQVVEAGNPWEGDCDDLSSTTLDMLIRGGVSTTRAWLVLVDTDKNGILDHMIAMVQDDAGKFWIVGDTMRSGAYPADEIKHKVLEVARADNILNWTPANGLGAFPQNVL